MPSCTVSSFLLFVSVLLTLINVSYGGPISFIVCKSSYAFISAVCNAATGVPLSNVTAVFSDPLPVVSCTVAAISYGGTLAYGICQTGCNALAVSCYTANGVTFGTLTACLGVSAAILGCNASLGACMAACVASGAAPTQ